QDNRIIAGVYHLNRELGKHFSLKDINLQVANGEFVFLVGPSGAGKSTLLRMIYMDDFPTSGQVVVGPYVSTRMKRRTIPDLRRKIGIIFQDFRLLEDRNVFENIALAMKVTGAGMGEIKRQVTDILTRVGLYHKRYDYPPALSGGEQQRIAIARAVANRPAILLADEPTGNLDPVATKNILEILFKINAGGTAVLMATHDIELVRSFGQRIIYLEEGRVVRDMERIYVGDIRDRIDDSSVSKDAERLAGQEITGDQGDGGTGDRRGGGPGREAQ
ncbi:MAG TPA: cell division ATP-binding protein FtsE, partial [Candidatus Krumholzibacterium sp.]|nr:cell division ATP-binding protein FtsE [Candidatus Krumholzibacterium sp.]